MSNVKDLALFGDAITSTSTGIKLNEANALALSAYNKTIGTVAVDAFIYDTSKDSDGGAWRKRTEHTSWYNETLNTATRGSRREFPAVAVIVAESNKVTIYDGDEPDCPMWMVFNNGVNTFFWTNSILSITAKNGILCVAANRINEINFISDSGTLHDTAGFFAVRSNISDRDVVPASTPIISSQSIVNNAVNDVAMTVLPSAPIDDATGLPVPTIAVATDGGVSVITDSGNVWDITSTSNVTPITRFVQFTEKNEVLFMADSGSSAKWMEIFDIPTSDITYTYSSSGNNIWNTYIENGIASSRLTPSDLDGEVTNDMTVAGSDVAAGNTYGLGIGTLDPITSGIQNSNIATHITSSYNTGWQPARSKLITLSDTTEETIGSVNYSDTSPADGPELISNGTFDTDTTGWTAVNSTIESDTGRLKITNTSAGVYGDATFTFSVTANEEYYINWEAIAGTGSIFIQLAGQGDDTGFISAALTTSSYFYPTSSGDATITVRITELNSSSVPVDAGDYAFIDNISVVQKNDIIYNGRFDGGTLGWTVGGTGASVAEVSGELELTQTAGQTGYAYQTIDTVVDQMYKLTVTLRTGTGTTANVHIGNAEVLTNYGIISETSGTNVTQTIIFRAGVTTTYITLINNVAAGGTGYFDNISVVETTELIANGEFTYDTTGWQFEGTGTDTSAPGYLEYTAGAAVNSCATQAITTEIGKLYRVEADYVSGTSNAAIYIATAAFGTDVGSTQFALSGNKLINTFKATTTTTYISLMVGSGTETGRFDNVSVKEADELVENGDFGRLTTGWNSYSGGILSIDTQRLKISGDSVSGQYGTEQTLTTEAGKRYVITFDIELGTSGTNSFFVADTDWGGGVVTISSDGTYSYTVTAGDTSSVLYIHANSANPSGHFFIDNVSVRLAEVDRSSYQDGLQIHGQLTKSVVAPGAELVAYSGWSTEHYLEQPYNSELNFGTGDFCLMAWVKMSNNTSSNRIVEIINQTGALDYTFLGQETNGDFRFQTDLSSGANIAFVNNIGTDWTLVVGIRRGDTNEIYINGDLRNSIAQAVTDDSFDFTSGVVAIGGLDTDSSAATIALVRVSATAPTAEQIKKIYEDERKLFQEDAKCTIYGSSDNVTALAYDDKYKQLHVGTSAGRSVFNGLVRADNTTTAVATVISANNKMVAEQ